MVHKGLVFKNKTIELDGNTFVDCQFDDCELVFRGKDPVDLGRCHFNRPKWQFHDGAGDTITLLRMLYADPVGRSVVKQALGIP